MSDNMATHLDPDPRRQPPEFIKKIYKHYQKLAHNELDTDPGIIDFNRGLEEQQLRFVKECFDVRCILPEQALPSTHDQVLRTEVNVKMYEHTDMPGLFVIPFMLQERTQLQLVSSLLHDCLADERHKTNVHLHHLVPYPCIHGIGNKPSIIPPAPVSFFNVKPDTYTPFLPKNSLIHKPITISQFLQRKLRWITLGGQYDWTLKQYPKGEGPPFPKYVADLVRSFFPSIVPEAAIVNVYTPGDTLSVHRDVSEDSGRGLVSISLGCDAVFVIGIEGDEGKASKQLVIRLRSGDTVYMSRAARFAWHGVPQIIPGTCPDHLKDWPAARACIENEGTASQFDDWRGWMSNKRINLNVRQIKD